MTLFRFHLNSATGYTCSSLLGLQQADSNIGKHLFYSKLTPVIRDGSTVQTEKSLGAPEDMEKQRVNKLLKKKDGKRIKGQAMKLTILVYYHKFKKQFMFVLLHSVRKVK